MGKRPVEAREPSGRPQRERLASPAEIRRLREAAWRGLRDPEWGTELGRLFLESSLTPLQYAAGRRFQRELAAYHSAIGAFPVRAISLESHRSTPPDPDSPAGKAQARREAEAIETFFEAHAVLVTTGAELLVRGLVERDEALNGLESLLRVRAGLSELARFYALTETGKERMSFR